MQGRYFPDACGKHYTGLIGVFDSGVGGLCAYYELRRMLPREDIVYLADRKHAPYGTKTEDEILAFTKENIRILKDMGASAVLIACCSASTVYHRLEAAEREISLPIISPAARIAAKNGRRIAVIATNHTVKSRAFSREIGLISDATVIEMAEQRLVSLVERGNRDGRIYPECIEYLAHLTERIRMVGADALILGCTHFSHLEGELLKRLSGVNIISPARAGAEEMVKKIIPGHTECGRDIYISP